MKKSNSKNIPEATDELICNKITEKITIVLRRSPQSSSETVESEAKNTGFDREIPKDR